MEDPYRSTSNWMTVSFAIFAAFCGMSSCYAAAGALQATGNLFASFFIGGIVTAVIFWVLMRTSPAEARHRHARGAAPDGRAPRPRRGAPSSAETASDPRIGPIVVFLSMALLFAVTGALMAGASAGSTGVPPKSQRETLNLWISGAWKGALIGLVLSLPLSTSASGIAWIMRRRR